MKKAGIIAIVLTFVLTVVAYAGPKVAIVKGDEKVLKDSWKHEQWINFVPRYPEGGRDKNLYWPPEWTKASEKEIEKMVRKAVKLAGGWPVKKGDTVLLKINVNGDLWDQASIGRGASNELLCIFSDARVARAVALLCKESGAKKIYIAEAPGCADAIYSLNAFGHNEYTKEAGAELVSLNDRPYRWVKAPHKLSMKEYAIPDVVLDADVVISISPMKTHSIMGFTCTLKNIGMGCPPGRVYGSPKTGLPHNKCYKTICDVCEIVDADYGVISAIYAGEGIGPCDCDPVYMGLVIAGSDLVATDTTACKVMGFVPSHYGVLRLAEKIGLGTMKDIEVVGEDVWDVMKMFKPCPKKARTPAAWGGIIGW